METTWCLGCTQANGHGQSCASLPHELGRCEAAPIQELYSCNPAAPLLILLAMLSSIWPVQRAAHACSNRHILAFASSGAWSTALAALDQGRHIHSRAQCKPGKQISPPSPPSCFQTSLEDLTMNQSYSFAEMHRMFIQFDRSVQIFLKDKKAWNWSWFLTT